MRRIANARIASLAAALTAGALAAYTLRSGPSATPVAQVSQPAVEVRTQVIRRTVHVVRHERARHKRSSSGAKRATGTGRVRARSPPPRARRPAARTAPVARRRRVARSPGPPPRALARAVAAAHVGLDALEPRRAAPVRTHTSGAKAKAPSSSGSSAPCARAPAALRRRLDGRLGSGRRAHADERRRRARGRTR